MGEASKISIKALGPQDEYLIDKNLNFDLGFRQYTDFSIDHVSIPFGIKPYPGTRQQIEIDPRSFNGDLISNMHLYVKLPNIGNTHAYCDNIGRNIIKTVTFSVNEQIIETLTSDWLVIKDQVFLDTDERAGLSHIINDGFDVDTDDFKKSYSTNPREVQLIIPLEFFFCRRHSPYKKERDRVSRPFFPVCAVTRQKIYVTIEFNNSVYFTNFQNTVDFSDQCKLVVETITLTDAERMKYYDDFSIIINKVYKEGIEELPEGLDTGIFNISANFPITTTFWFFRKKTYEQETVDVFDSHQEFGYSYTDDVSQKYVDPFLSLTLFINNEDVTPDIEGNQFFKLLQPINYNLSTPNKEIYMYCYGTDPKEYNTGGSYDFSQVPSKSTFIKYKLNKDVVTDLTRNYTFNMYHYGYNIVRFSGGFVTLAFL
jgi:hypothetical protein